MIDICLHNKRFRSISNSTNGEVSGDTIFHYRQKGSIIWATYEGGNVLFGTLSGRIENNLLEFTYQHQNKMGEFMTGKCSSEITTVDDKLQLHETWHWTCKDFSNGYSVIEEI